MNTKLKSWAFLVLAVGFAGATLLMAMQINRGEAAPVARRVVLAAKGTIERGTKLAPGQLESIPCPQVTPPAGVILKPEDAIGCVAVRAVEAGQPIPADALVPPGTTEAMLAQLPKGMRLLPVQAEEPRNPGASLPAGSFVDVVAIYDRGPQQRQWDSELILQHVRVAGVGMADQNAKPGAGKTAGGTVMLEVPAAEAESVARVAGTARLHLLLRHPEDDERIPQRVVNAPESPPSPVPCGPPPGARCLELRMGPLVEKRWYVAEVDSSGRVRWVEWKPEIGEPPPERVDGLVQANPPRPAAPRVPVR